jgi:superfamily II DNA helicase RecQ
MQKYIEQIAHLDNPTFQEIRRIARKSLTHFSTQEHNKLWEELEHGVTLLNTHESMCKYLDSYGNMHEAKINIALKELNQAELEGEFDIIDWGCGQGLATISFFDYLKRYKLNASVKNVILIEPSKMALERAKLHVSAYQNDNLQIKTVNKFLNEVTNQDIITDGFRPVIHFFSNILDIKEIDLRDIAVKLNQSILTDNYIITVGPLNTGNRRIDAFYDYFKVPIIFEINEFRFDYGGSKPCSFKAKVYKLQYNEEGRLIPIEYYPSVQFNASYELDCIKRKRKTFAENEELKAISDKLTRYEISAPFDIGASVYDDVDPLLAVLNNIVTRGLPTKASPFIEKLFEQNFDFIKSEILRGEISFNSKKEISYKEILLWVKKAINSKGELNYTEIDLTQLQLILTPIAVARVQKTILEALMTGQIDYTQDKWDVLVEEHDVPCAAIAFRDLEQMFNNLTQLSEEYQHLKFPKVNLEILTTSEYSASPLHLDANTRTEILPVQRIKKYDLVIDIALLQKANIDKTSFSKFNCKKQCYFNIRAAVVNRSDRNIYTSKQIKYKNLVLRDSQGNYAEITEAKALLNYFMQLLFRKQDFRPGQLPILNRALQNKSVIGLLPTGGGKSLTYQLAAMLQPGVTLIVDPLSSLMRDQYDGLMSAGIDCCTYINSTIAKEDRKIREFQMQSSQMIFVFLSPERLAIYEFRERLKNMYNLNIYFSYGVIDEVHCVSEWGHDFRIPYLHLGRNLYKYVRAKDGIIPLFGLTATASFDVLADVERELSGEGAFVLDADTIVRFENTNRLELQYKVEKVDVEFDQDTNRYDEHNELDPALPKPVNLFGANNSKAFQNTKNRFLTTVIQGIPKHINELQTLKATDLIKKTFIERQDNDDTQKVDLSVEMPSNFYEKKEHYEQAGIVFCPHKANTGISVKTNQEVLSKTIADIGTFSGGDDIDKSSMKNLELFRDSKQPIMVATKAFGMGIDKPNVRFTVNMNYSSSLESFVQEAGRAGRDRKMALSTILLSYYHLSRINEKCPAPTFHISEIKNRWYHTADLQTIIKHYNLKIDNKYIDICSPQHDQVQIDCEKKNTYDEFILRKGSCKTDCSDEANCNVKDIPRYIRNRWQSIKELESYKNEQNIKIDKKHIRYQNADYESVMYFYNSSFKGADIENWFMIDLLSSKPVTVFYGNDAEKKPTELFAANGFLTSLMNATEDKEVVSFIPYIKSDKGLKIQGNDMDIAKAIYRLTCIGLIEDFTNDYNHNQFRIVAKKKKEGEYYNGLERFLHRYYTEERAEQEIILAKNFKLEIESDNELKNEIHRCLAFLTHFVYTKISVKRKRAIDDMRNFCIQGIDEAKDWKLRNEELKDFIYYYFNSKYAKEDYIADNGELYSLTVDTDYGKISDSDILFKYLKVIEDELVGVGVPIDNVKHLQGAVRLLRRSLTDENPTLSLLNAFCLSFLGTKNNQNLENELLLSYKEGMEEFENRIDDPVVFWKLFDNFNFVISPFPKNKQLSQLKQEIMLSIHGKTLKNITEKYMQ